jgi:hypothetical protein
VALVKMFLAIDAEWYRCSHGTYRVCREGTINNLVVIPVKTIRTLVGMVPDPQRGEQMFCVVRKPGCSAVRTGVDIDFAELDRNEDDE